MGLNANYSLTIKRENLKSFFIDITLNHTDGVCKCNSTEFEIIDPKKITEQELFNGNGFALSLGFEPDEEIEEYLKKNPIKNATKKMVYIGLIYLYMKPNYSLNNYVDISFKAAASDMALLFATSNPISDFFISISKKHNALLMLRDFSATITILWYKNQACFQTLDFEIAEQEFMEVFFLQNVLEKKNHNL